MIADASSIRCTCCCALSHGSTWQLPIRPYLRSSVLDAVVAHTRPSARRAARRYSMYGELGGRQRDDVASVERSDRAASSSAAGSAGSMWMLRGRFPEPSHSLKSTMRSERSRASAHGRSGARVCVSRIASASSSSCQCSTATDDNSVCCYDGDCVGTLAATPHSALGCQASGGCELRDDARGERVLSATRRTDCARRRPPSSSHPEYRRAARRALGRTYRTSGASSEARRRHRFGSCHVPPCDNAQQHVHLMELASAITADLVVDEDGALLHHAASHHRRVARLRDGRADRAEHLHHRHLAKSSLRAVSVKSSTASTSRAARAQLRCMCRGTAATWPSEKVSIASWSNLRLADEPQIESLRLREQAEAARSRLLTSPHPAVAEKRLVDTGILASVLAEPSAPAA